MEIWKRILGKGKSQVPDSLTTSDWLHNMSDVFLQCGVEVLQKNPSSPALLAYFTLLNSTISTYNILHLMPDTHSKVGEIFREFRLYYDCLWQNCLLERYNSESEKVSHLYAWVDLQFVGILK